jgi:hypothetical protein
LNQKTKRRILRNIERATRKRGLRFFRIADGRPVKTAAELLAMKPEWSNEIGWHLAVTAVPNIHANGSSEIEF